MIKDIVKKSVYKLKLNIYSAEHSARKYNYENSTAILPAAAPGGLGDDAMVNGAIESIRTIETQEHKISIMVPKNISNYSFRDGVSMMKKYSTWKNPKFEADSLTAHKNFFVLGADVLDGAYGAHDAMKRIKLARLCTEAGRNSRVVGFSLNENPSSIVISEFKKLKKTPIYLRDPISYSRAIDFFGERNVHLSADVAFMLKPIQGCVSDMAKNFYEYHKREGRAVYGLNIHDLLSKFSGIETFNKMIVNLAKFIDSRNDLAFLLIPHDYRSWVDDRVSNNRIINLLNNEGRRRVLHLETPVRASEIKAACEYVDGVITGRMHLAIAALGMKKPVLGIVYQGKFEGTFSHFDLGNECILSPFDLAKDGFFDFAFENWQLHKNDIMVKIEDNLPKVRSLSLSNFM